MLNLIKKILIKVQRAARRRNLMQATREANKICLETGKTMLIYFYKGEYRYIAKQDMKKAGMSGKESEAIAQAKIVRYYGKQSKAQRREAKSSSKTISAGSEEVAGANR